MASIIKALSTGLLRLSLTTIVTFCFFSETAFSVTLTTGKDDQSFLPYWKIEESGMSLRFVQRIPDQVRAFFLSRGFSTEDAEHIATSCAFQTVLTNTSHKTVPDPLNFDLHEWVVTHKGMKSGMKTREDWSKEWDKKKVSENSKLTFKWALVPTQMEYRPNDYNWGMSFFNLKPGSVFDLKVVWRQYDKTHDYVIKGIQCAPDIHPDPETFRNE